MNARKLLMLLVLRVVPVLAVATEVELRLFMRQVMLVQFAEKRTRLLLLLRLLRVMDLICLPVGETLWGDAVLVVVVHDVKV